MVKLLKALLPGFSEIADPFQLDFSDYAPIKAADLVALATEKRGMITSP